MNHDEQIKLAYELGFQRALLLAGFNKEAGVGTWFAKLFRRSGPKNIVGGGLKKFQAEQAARRAAGLKPVKSTKELMQGGLPIQVGSMAQRMRPMRA